MTEEPPDWFDGGAPTAAPQSDARQSRRAPPARISMTKEEAAVAASEFLAWLTARERIAELHVLLPAGVPPEFFIDAAKAAVWKTPKLLRADLRPSLLIAIMDAASQGLMPDGKEGALMVRSVYDAEARQKMEAVCFQSMVWGIVKLGRETGAIKSIRADLVFNEEPFRIIRGDQDIIEHEVIPELVEAAYKALNAGFDQWHQPQANPDEFFRHVRAAYCVIDSTDGTRTKRWMTRERLVSLRDAAKSDKGPWNSRWIDEMILKGVILFTSKWINLDATSAPARRFQAALMADLSVDFDAEGIARPGAKPVQLLSAPPRRLDAIESLYEMQEAGKVEATLPPQAPPPRATPAQPAPDPETTPRQEPPTVAQWAFKVRKDVETLSSAAEIDTYVVEPDFVEKLARVKVARAKVAEEIMDAIADRRGFVAQLATA